MGDPSSSTPGTRSGGTGAARRIRPAFAPCREPTQRIRWECWTGGSSACTIGVSTAHLLAKKGLLRRGLPVDRPGGLLLCAGLQPKPEGRGCVLAADHAVSHADLHEGAPV